jgi:uncharacterized small protein (DUF1192 family)
MDTSTPNPNEICCGLCKEPLSEEKGINCATCVRNELYNVRVEYARVLLEKAELKKQHDQIVDPENNPATDEETKKLAEFYQAQQLELIGERHRAKEAKTLRMVDELEERIAAQRADLEKVKAAQAVRRANLEKAKGIMKTRYAKQIALHKKDVEKEKALHDAVHEQLIDAKASLCREAADLVNFQHFKRKTKDGLIKERFHIIGLPLPDLKDIHSEFSPSAYMCDLY